MFISCKFVNSLGEWLNSKLKTISQPDTMEFRRNFHKLFARYYYNKRIRNTLIRGIAGYLILVFVFGVLFYLFQSLSNNIGKQAEKLGFFDYFYFSLVTFSTIGYGEIIPSGYSGKFLIVIESCIGLAYTPFFGGYLAYLFIQRPKDFFLTECLECFRSSRPDTIVRIFKNGKQ